MDWDWAGRDHKGERRGGVSNLSPLLKHRSYNVWCHQSGTHFNMYIRKRIQVHTLQHKACKYKHISLLLTAVDYVNCSENIIRSCWSPKPFSSSCQATFIIVNSLLKMRPTNKYVITIPLYHTILTRHLYTAPSVRTTAEQSHGAGASGKTVKRSSSASNIKLSCFSSCCTFRAQESVKPLGGQSHVC